MAMMKTMKKGIPSLMKDGTRVMSGLEEAILRNIEACKALSEITRTSYGPNGMNKMVINHLDKMFVTSDTCTILQEMEVQHPAAKMIYLAGMMQEMEVGDGSNFVITLAGSLLDCAAQLIQMGLHPTDIISGYNESLKIACDLMDELSIWEIKNSELNERERLLKGILPAIAAKQWGQHDFLAGLCVDACQIVMPKNPYNFNVENVRVAKILGGNLKQSRVIKGMVLPFGAIGNVRHKDEARIAVFTCSIGQADTETKGTILIENATDLLNYSKSEEQEVERLVKSVVDSGVNVIITGSSVDDMAKHFMEKYGVMCIRVPSKFELRRVCRAVNAKAKVALGPLKPEEIGYCTDVKCVEIGSRWVTVLGQKQADDTAIATILLRSSTYNVLNDLQRAIDDGVNVARMIARGNPAKFLPGAGACEIEIAKRLIDKANNTSGLNQYAMKKFGEALEVFPRTLAENAGHSSLEIVSELYSEHEKGNANSGVNLKDGGVEDMTNTGVLDLASVKKQAMTLCVDAVVTILRVDQIIQSRPAGGPKAHGGQGGSWDAD